MKGNELNTALLALLSTTSTFNTSIGGRVYVNQAPLGTLTPFCVITTASDALSYDSGTEFQDVVTQFSVFAEEKTGAVSGRIIDELESLLSTAKATLSVTSGRLMQFRKSIRREDNNSNIFHKLIQYKIKIQIT